MACAGLGERTCKIVYGDSYDRCGKTLELHPGGRGVIVAGTGGPVAARGDLDARLRIVAACDVAGQRGSFIRTARGSE